MSHNQRMEKQTDLKRELTKANLPAAQNANQGGRVTITTNEAMEYREYKRQRKRAEILAAISASEGVLGELEDARRVSERAVRLRQAAVRLSLERIERLGDYFLQKAVPIDCTVGGDGETLTKVKAYEAKAAIKRKAKEITLALSPYAVANCRYVEIKKELKKIRHTARKVVLKVRVDKVYAQSILSRLAKICSEIGAQYFCIPYFQGCERLKMDLFNGCKLQVSGVKSLTEYQKLISAGVGRVVTERAWEFYSEWMREVEKINFPELSGEPQVSQEKTEEKPAQLPQASATQEKQEKSAEKEKSGLPAIPVSVTAALKAAEKAQEQKKANPETDYRCRLEGKDLKFL